MTVHRNPAAMARLLSVCLVLFACGGIRAEEPADTSRGDRLLDAYFKRQVQRIADAALADIKDRADWTQKRP